MKALERKPGGGDLINDVWSRSGSGKAAEISPGKRTLVEPSSLQQLASGHGAGSTTEQVQAAAAHGTGGAGGALPHLDKIQRLFGRHDVSQVKAHTDEAAREGAAAMGAEAFATGDHVAFAGSADLHTAAHEAAHVVQQRGGVQLKGGVGEVGDAYEQHADQVADAVVAGRSAEQLLDPYAGDAATPAHGGSIRRVGSAGVQHLPIQRQQQAAPGQRPADANLAQRVDVLERRQAATEMDLRWRARLGGRIAVYRQAVYALTTAFQKATTSFAQAHSDQAQAEAIKDQVGIAILNVAAAGMAEPFLRANLGGLGTKLNAVVEWIENPLLAAGQGATATAGTVSSQNGGTRPPTGAPDGSGSGDPLSFLSQNLQEVEHHNQLMEAAFSQRITRMSSFTDDQWLHWNTSTQDSEYARLLQSLDSVALSDVAQLEAPQTLHTKIELYFWARWLSSQYIPGARGLQVGPHLAQRMKAIGLGSLAGVYFDTSSLVLMEHRPENWEQLLVAWSRGYRARLSR